MIYEAKWYLGVAFNGDLAVTEGIADVSWNEEAITIVCRLTQDTRYATIYATLEESSVLAVVKNEDPTVPDFNCAGVMTKQDDAVSLVLSDGWSTFGISMRL